MSPIKKRNSSVDDLSELQGLGTVDMSKTDGSAAQATDEYIEPS